MSLYRDLEKQREANKEASQRRRDKVKGMTTEGMTELGMTKDGTYFKDGIEMVGPAYIEGVKGRYEFLPERQRYFALNDRYGQILDRANMPDVDPTLVPSWMRSAMKRTNDSIQPIKRGDKGARLKEGKSIIQGSVL